jgi:hypothetical protein
MATTAVQILCNSAKTKLDQVSNLVRALVVLAASGAEATSVPGRSSVGVTLLI